MLLRRSHHHQSHRRNLLLQNHLIPPILRRFHCRPAADFVFPQLLTGFPEFLPERREFPTSAELFLPSENETLYLLIHLTFDLRFPDFALNRAFAAGTLNHSLNFSSSFPALRSSILHSLLQTRDPQITWTTFPCLYPIRGFD